MANTLTALAPVLYSAARVTPRELTGILGACQTNFDSKGVAKGDTVTIPIAPVLSSASVTPAQVFTVGSNRTPTSKVLTLSNYKEVKWHLTAEEDRSLLNAGVAQDMLKQTIEQGLRTLVNEIETDTWLTARAGASRAVGTAATVPFGTNTDFLVDCKTILDDNGASPIDRSFVMNTAAAAKMAKIATLQKVNEAGNDALLRQGVLGSLFGFDLRQSAAPVSTTAGTGGTSYVTNTPAAATLAIGTTTIGLDTGSGTILAGDVITFTGDTNKYVVKTGITAAGDIVIAEPGLRQTLADGVASAVGAAATAHIAMCRNSVVAVVRPALQPDGAIAEQMVITDPQSKLSFLMLRVPGDSLVSWYIRCVYASFCPNSYAAAQLLG